MPSLQVANGAQLRLIWSFQSGAITAINVLGVQVSGAPVFGQALADTLGAAIKAAVSSSGIGGHLQSTNALLAVGIRDLRTTNMAEFLDSGGPAAGTGTAADQLPGQTALVVTLRTAKSGPSYRGRVYLGGFSETSNTATGTALGSLVTVSAAFITAIRTTLTNNALTLAVLSRPAEAREVTTLIHHSDGSTSSITKHSNARTGQATPVTAVQVRNATWDTQRRRAAGGSVSTFLMPLISIDEDGTVTNRMTGAHKTPAPAVSR
jgi:hypothetical protein